MIHVKTAAEHTLWIWDWQGGGFNWCWASSKQEAQHKALSMHVNLRPVNIRPTTNEEIDRYYREYPLD